MRTLKTFQGTHILGASRGLLCDSYAVLFSIASLAYLLASQTVSTKHNAFDDRRHRIIAYSRTVNKIYRPIAYSLTATVFTVQQSAVMRQ